MSEELELTGGSAGIDRRDFIRKTAIVGGMVWAAPMIQSIGSPAFAFSPNGEGNGEGDISYVAFIVRNQGSGRFKFDYEDCPDFGTGAGQVNSAKQCGGTEYTGTLKDSNDVLFTSFGAAFDGTPAGSTTNFTINTTCPVKEGDPWVFNIVDSGTTEYFFDSGVVKSGLICEVASITNGGKTLTANPISQN